MEVLGRTVKLTTGSPKLAGVTKSALGKYELKDPFRYLIGQKKKLMKTTHDPRRVEVHDLEDSIDSSFDRRMVPTLK